MEWIWDLANSFAAVGALVIGVVTVVRTRAIKPEWELVERSRAFPGIQGERLVTYAVVRHHGPVVCEHVTYSVKAPKAKWVEHTEGFVPRGQMLPLSQVPAHELVIIPLFGRDAPESEAPYGSYRIRVHFRCAPNPNTPRKSKTFKVVTFRPNDG